MSLLFAGALLSLYLVQVSSVAMAGYDLERLEEERQVWLSRNQQLEVELAKRRSLAWTEAQATQHLGMTKSERPLFLEVKPGEADDDVTTIRAFSSRPAPGARSPRPQPATPIDALRDWLTPALGTRP